MAGQLPQAAHVGLTLVRGVLLEAHALDLGNPLERKTDDVEDRARDGGGREGALRGIARGGQCDGAEGYGVDAVVEGVEEADCEGWADGELFLRDEEAPVDLLDDRADGHGQEGQARRGKAERVNQRESCLGGDARDASTNTEGCEQSKAQPIGGKDVVLDEGVQGAQTDKERGAAGGRVARAPVDEVPRALFRQ